MTKRVIRVGLSQREINKAIRDIERYKQEFQKKVETYRKRIAEEIATQALLNFGNAIVDDVVNGSPRKADVNVSVSERGAVSVVVADGDDAVWCEFGAGVYHNGSVGSSPNPYGNDLGFTIGSYGKGRGKQQAWGYYDENNELVITRGTPASMPMYNAVQEVMRKSIIIAKEIFG